MQIPSSAADKQARGQFLEQKLVQVLRETSLRPDRVRSHPKRALGSDGLGAEVDQREGHNGGGERPRQTSGGAKDR